MSKFTHTPDSAAKAVRSLFEGSIARTWQQYFSTEYHVNSYTAAKIVQEQCGCAFREASLALETAIPELFAEYWEGLPL